MLPGSEDQSPPSASPGVPTAPPTRPGAIGVRGHSAPVWHNVFGIASTGLGILAILQGAGGLVGALFFDQFGGLVMTNDAQAKAAMKAMAGYSIASSIGTAVLGALNLLAGILLLKRRRGALPVILWWAALKLVFVIYVAWGSYHMTRATMTAVATPAAGGPPGVIMQASSALGAIFVVVWGWLYPLIVFFWFCRPRIRAQVRSWRTRT